MCDHGRLDDEWINRGERLEAPLVRDLTGVKAMGWKEALTLLVARLGDVEGTVKAVASPFASNEDLAALKALLESLGGGDVVYRLPRAEDEIVLKGFPTLARRRDLAPNGRGADLLGMRRVGGDDGTGGLDDVSAHAGVVIVLGDGLADQGADFASGAALRVYLGTHAGPAAAAADFVLPITTFAEQEGTFTNHEGRVQRFWPALRAPGLARPAWLVLGALVAEGTGSETPRRADEAFARLVAVHDAFTGLSYDDIGTRGAVVNDTVPLSGD
jgi:NADH-quinone oxidoreductase subunit G